MEFGAETETTPQGRMTSACLQHTIENKSRHNLYVNKVHEAEPG
jgi:hypothetical protein